MSTLCAKTLRLTALAAALLAWGRADAALIVNGGFETPVVPVGSPGYLNFGAGGGIPGWTVITDSVDVVSEFHFPASEGAQSLDLDGDTPGAIEQSFSTAISQEYHLTFVYANNPFSGVFAHASVVVEGTTDPVFSETINHFSSSVGNMNYTHYRRAFVANSTTTTLRFVSLDPVSSFGGIVFDEVDVTPVPEPTSGVLALAAMACRICVRRRAATAASC